MWECLSNANVFRREFIGTPFLMLKWGLQGQFYGSQTVISALPHYYTNIRQMR